MTLNKPKGTVMKIKVNWRVTKLIPILILITTIILAFRVYADTYRLTEDPDRLAAAISDYIPDQRVKAEVKLTNKGDDWMYVIFSDRQYGECFMGMALLHRGWNGRYVIRSAEYGSGPVVSMHIKPDDKNQVMIYGLVRDGRAVRYEYAKSIQDIFYEVMYQGNIDQEAFFHVQENKGYWMTHFRLFDVDGKDITDSYIKMQRKDAPSGVTSTAELFMVNVKCLFILLIGAWVAVGSYKLRHNKNIKLS